MASLTLRPTLALPTLALPTLALPTLTLPTLALPTLTLSTLALFCLQTYFVRIIDQCNCTGLWGQFSQFHGLAKGIFDAKARFGADKSVPVVPQMGPNNGLDRRF